MKERQRWRPEEDALLHAYVKQYGPRDWHLVSSRMSGSLNRDAKSCLERWKNYLKPGVKKGSLTQEEQQLVIHLQAKHGNKWKKIASQVPGRTAKRLGKWWEVFKEKQQRQHKKSKKIVGPIQEGKYDTILETFAEKLVKERGLIMPTPSSGIFNSDPFGPPVRPHCTLPPWLACSSATTTVRSPSPPVTLSLLPSTVPHGPVIPWLQSPPCDKSTNDFSNVPAPESPLLCELFECCKELEEGHRALAAHRKEAAWRLKRVELQLESEKACRRKEKIEEIEAKIRALKEEEKAMLGCIEGEYREQLAALRRDAEAKEQKLAEQWIAKHLRLTKFLEQTRYGIYIATEPNGY